MRKIGFNSREMDMEVKIFLFETYCRSASQYALSNMYLTQKDTNDLSILENKILKAAFGFTKYHSTSMLLSAIQIKPLGEVLKLRKLQLLNQLLRYDLTAKIIEFQLANQKNISNKSLIGYVLTILNSPEEINDIDTLITATLDKITRIEENIAKNENTESADGIRYLLKHYTPKNQATVRKLLSWEVRAAQKAPKTQGNQKKPSS